jgi:hypothetical protein
MLKIAGRLCLRGPEFIQMNVYATKTIGLMADVYGFSIIFFSPGHDSASSL